MLFILLVVVFVAAISFLLLRKSLSGTLKIMNPIGSKRAQAKEAEIRHAILNEIKKNLDISPKNPLEEVVIFRFIGLANVIEIRVNLQAWNQSSYECTIFKITWDFWIEGLHIKSGTFMEKIGTGPKSPKQDLCLREVLLDSQSSDMLWISQKEKTSGYVEGVAYCETAYGRFQKKFSLLKISFLLVGEAKEKPKDMMSEANLDGLTGLLQRKYLEDNLQTIIDRNIHRAPISFAMIDIDNFKKINDESGHLAGDEVLKTVCALIKEALHNRAIAIRYGGDEIAIVLSNCAVEEARATMEIIRSKVEKNEFTMQGGIVRATISVGVAALTQQANYKILIRTADNMLRFSKQNGKNRVSVNLRKIEPED